MGCFCLEKKDVIFFNKGKCIGHGKECSGLEVECLTSDRGVACSSLTGGTVLCT